MLYHIISYQECSSVHTLGNFSTLLPCRTNPATMDELVVASAWQDESKKAYCIYVYPILERNAYMYMYIRCIYVYKKLICNLISSYPSPSRSPCWFAPVKAPSAGHCDTIVIYVYIVIYIYIYITRERERDMYTEDIYIYIYIVHICV